MLIKLSLTRPFNWYTWINNSGVSHERFSRILVGSSVLSILAMGYFFNPYCYYLFLALAINLIQSGITEKCLVKDLLIKIGFKGERELGEKTFTRKYSKGALS